MHGRPVRLTLEFSTSEFAQLARAAQQAHTPTEEFVRLAAMRMAAEDAALSDSRHGLGGRGTSMSPSRRSLRPVTPHASTLEIVHLLAKFLDVQLLAITVGTKAEDVKRWVAEASTPSPLHERRLRDAYEAWQLVGSVESPETTRAWWMGMKDELDDLSPAEAIALDRGRAVMSVARAFVESG